MKRADITELFPEAPKESIDKIMSLYGADVNAVKAEVETLKAQLQDALNNPKGAEDLEKAQKQVEQLTAELEGMKTAESIRVMREKISNEKRVPAHLLTGETEEACAQQADAILAFAQPGGYPVVRDGGDPHNQTKPTTRETFAAWAQDNL